MEIANIHEAESQLSQLVERAMDGEEVVISKDAGEEAKQPSGQGSLGAMWDAADELDEVVEHVMKLRRQPRRVLPGE